MKNVIFASIALLMVSAPKAFANFEPGRVDLVAVCSSAQTNGFQLIVREVEGVPGMKATLSQGGVAGYTPVMKAFAVKLVNAAAYTTFIVDQQTGGEKLKVKILDRPTDLKTRVPNAKATWKLQNSEQSGVLMSCAFPAHVM